MSSFSDILGQLEDENLRRVFSRLRDDEIEHEKLVCSLQDKLRQLP